MQYHIRANRRMRLEGEQLNISFPRRGRPSRHRRLECAGQMRLGLNGQIKLTAAAKPECKAVIDHFTNPETFEAARELTFPERPLTEPELMAEFERLFPAQ